MFPKILPSLFAPGRAGVPVAPRANPLSFQDEIAETLDARFALEDMSPTSPQAVDAIRSALLTRVACLEVEARRQRGRAAAARDLAGTIDLPADVRDDLHRAFGDAQNPGAADGHPASAGDDTAVLARQWLNRNRPSALWSALALCAVGLTLSGIVEVAAVYRLVGSALGTDEFGNPTAGGTFVAIAGSAVTLCGYWLLGMLWPRQRAAAVGLYGVVLAFVLAFGIVPSYGGAIAGLWATVAAFAGTASDPPLGWSLALSALAGAIYTLPGIVFIGFKSQVQKALGRLRTQREVAEIASAFDTAFVETEREAAQSGLIDLLESPEGFSAVMGTIQGTLAAKDASRARMRRATLLLEASDVRKPRAARRRASEALAAENGSITIGMALLCGALLVASAALAPAVHAEGAITKDLLAHAPVFQVLLDNSEGSPATNPKVVEAVWPEVETELRRQPLGATIIVASVGDSALPPLVWRTRVQARATPQGLPLEAVVREVKRRMLNFPATVAADGPHKSSHLAQGFFDAVRDANPAAESNTVFFVTDLIEYTPTCNCYRLATCTLPPPAFRVPGNTRLTVYGIGLGLPSESAVPLWKKWEDFFAKAGVARGDLRFHRAW